MREKRWEKLMKTARSVAFALTVLLSAGVLGACSSDDSGSGASTSAAASQAPATTAPATSAPAEPETPAATTDANQSAGQDEDADLRTTEFPVSTVDAIGKAMETAGQDGVVHGVELAWDSNRWEYTIDVYTPSSKTDHEISIDATTGEVTDVEKDAESDAEKGIDQVEFISYVEALEKAAALVDASLEGWSLDWDDDRLEWTFDFRVDNDDEVTVDAQTGEVTRD
ncbi:PepSY domain-containing protein [Actinobaculum massiliense]|uniref:PepSY domain-containing protein n=1 Tax=Actinobaculum massiliense TaxID=202789 RepID=UPI0009DB4C53|nr:PepSY domain-containing protein [Actinobaculum massiliense]MDK8319787.1 PepSY domain-containing protein [Actinobaculum massiliense]MDK8567820.1 PepSY domain-containing protein [Actinobaculum massiliense]